MIGTFATAAAGMLETARWAYSDSPSGDVLRRVSETGVQLAWWRRAPEDALITCLARLPDAALPKLRIAATPGRLTAALEAELGSTAASFRGVIGDIGALGARFAAIAGARRLRVRLEKVTDDACSRWHADRTPLRLLCTYRGAPSLLAKPGAVTGDAHGCVLGVDEAGIGQRLDPAAEAEVRPAIDESRAPVVVLLRHHAVQADDAAGQVRHRRLPQREAVPLAAALGPHQVEAQEAEAAAVAHVRDHAHRLVAEVRDQEAGRVGGEEALVIVQAGVPALGRGPVDAQGQFGGAHRADVQCGRAHRAVSLASMRRGSSFLSMRGAGCAGTVPAIVEENP